MSRKRRRKRRKGSRGKYVWLAPMLSVLCVLACVGIAAVYFLLRPAGAGTDGKEGQSAGSEQNAEQSSEQNLGQKPAQEAGQDSGQTPAQEPEQAAPEPEPTEEELRAQKAREILNGMTLEEKVGQMFIVRCPEEDAAAKAEQYHLGGYILFARDFEDKTPETVREAIEAYQRVSELPMLIGVDEEGGTVTRISRYPAFRAEPFASPQELYQAGGLEAVAQDTEEKCELLESLGVNVNFAPVCDVSENPSDFIYERSFGQNAQLTAEYVRTVVEKMRERGMLCVLKHFPGYGNNADTHTGIAYDSRPYETFETSDFLPFQAGIESGAQMVLVSHNIVSCMDGERPASLSPRVHEILREELGFTGVIVTDDLAMDGVRDFTDDGNAAVLAVQAGNDLLCCADFKTQIPAVLEAVEGGEITEERIEESVLRILEMKLAVSDFFQ